MNKVAVHITGQRSNCCGTDFHYLAFAFPLVVADDFGTTWAIIFCVQLDCVVAIDKVSINKVAC